MQWLRAQARKDRWAEECDLLEHEMEWTTNFFFNKAQHWEDLMEQAGHANRDGHRSYAARQAYIYKAFAAEAKRMFQVVRQL